ncbi:MAG: YibE/F family protein, partial [Oscillospiraceae bacterium]|nr:YibE/F family protein [Oscillospiraceae bacterium]
MGKLRYYAPVEVCLLLIALLLTVPTGFEDAVQYQEAERCIAEVLSVDDSSIVDTGLVRSGEQRCTVRFTNGTFKGQTATAINLLQGS